MTLDKNKVAVGLSGGVDSAVAAYLLKKEGKDVIGVTMLPFEAHEAGQIKVPAFIEEAKEVAEKLRIPHYTIDLRGAFSATVEKEFLETYLQGKTPNPCVTCNRIIKYGKLLEAVHNLGAYYMATGHYANIRYDQNLKRYRIFSGATERKDQAYLLHSLGQEQLKHILLPLGEYGSKAEIREIAKTIDLNISEKSDSQGICFVPDDDFVAYLAQRSEGGIRPGNFVDMDGEIIGRHQGIVRYTIGQRRGLGMTFDQPKYVVGIRADTNEVILGNDEDTYAKGLIATQPNFTHFDELESDLHVEVKVCQWGWRLPATLSNMGQGRIKVLFDKKERAIAPGQAAVFYDGNEILGGATIESVIKE